MSKHLELEIGGGEIKDHFWNPLLHILPPKLGHNQRLIAFSKKKMSPGAKQS